jgi:hypothetical protein
MFILSQLNLTQSNNMQVLDYQYFKQETGANVIEFTVQF